MDLSDRVALVTGGARRVGRTLALALAQAGADVVVAHHGSGPEAAETANAIRSTGRRAAVLRADLSLPESAATLVEEVRRSFGRLDLLVNSAARFDAAPIEEVTAEAWDLVMAVNLRAPFLLAQAAAPVMRAGGQGLIVNIADLSAFQAWPQYVHHAVSKAGLVHLTRVLARALAPTVRVNCIAPGTVLPPTDFDAEDIERLRRRIPLGHLGSAADVAGALLYLVEADFVTGQTLVVDGGRSLG
jgi:pteridine reductase